MPFLRIFIDEVMYLSESYKNRLKSLSGIISEDISNIQELDTADVSIPVSYIKESLNTQIWDNDQLRPEIREHILTIVDEYKKHLDLKVQPKAVRMLGSMANFNWTDVSDIDVHLFYDLKEISDNTVLAKDLLESKGKDWKDNHDIKIKGFNVELYAQDISDKYHSGGIYDLLKNDWISKPNKENVTIDKESIKKKAASIATEIEDIEKQAQKNSDSSTIYNKSKKIKDKIKRMRQSGLDKSGEFSVENLAFKYLRNNGYLERLGNITSKSFDKNLSLDEINMNEDKSNINSKYLKKVIFKNKQLKMDLISIFLLR